MDASLSRPSFLKDILKHLSSVIKKEEEKQLLTSSGGYTLFKLVVLWFGDISETIRNPFIYKLYFQERLK